MSDTPTEGTVVADRYEIRRSLGQAEFGQEFLAFDRRTGLTVTLTILSERGRVPGNDEGLHQQLLRAASVRHPNVCPLLNAVMSAFGAVMVTEFTPGPTLHTHLRRRKARGGYELDEFREIAQGLCAGLTAMHQQGLVHGDLKPDSVIVAEGITRIVDFGFSRLGSALRDGCVENEMSPELRFHDGTPEDDVRALGLTLWAMWCGRVPETGSNPRGAPIRSQPMVDVPSGLSIDEVKQIYCCLNEDASMRPRARHLRFFDPAYLSKRPISAPRDRLDPGSPLGAVESFLPGAQALLVTYATHATETVGQLFPLVQPIMRLGRRGDQDIVLPESTVSGQHALLRWQGRAWAVEDRGSTNGTYADLSYDRHLQVQLVHAAEVQIGELRLKLVSFPPDSVHHQRARAFLAKRDGLTGLLGRAHFLRNLDDEAAFAEWAGATMTIAHYEVSNKGGPATEGPTILEMLALRRVAARVVELTERLLLSLLPVVAGRTGPLRFAVAMVGLSVDEAGKVVKQIVWEVEGLLPPSFELRVKVGVGDER